MRRTHIRTYQNATPARLAVCAAVTLRLHHEIWLSGYAFWDGAEYPDEALDVELFHVNGDLVDAGGSMLSYLGDKGQVLLRIFSDA